MLDSNFSPDAPLGLQLASASRRWRSNLDERMQPLGLTQSRWEVLMQIERLGEGVIQSVLASALGIEMPSLSRSLDQLEANGLVERRCSESDKRARTVHFTSAGRALQIKADAVRQQVVKETLEGITEAELAEFIRVLQKLSHNLM
ncbi:Transcriptional regulator SlyA [Carnimonas sp. R-84981]|uniref:transcriptional regulator SlyA n=1 Tax=Carnimonas bestiolae TaxID=3402172 RepID=UPI003EDBDB48